MIARAYITLKEGVLDPQGKTVQKGLQSIGGYLSVDQKRKNI